MHELLAKLPTPDKLFACTATPLDGVLLAAIGERVRRSQKNQTAPRNISLPELEGIYAIGIGVNFTQRQRADHALTESWQRLINAGFLMQAVGQSAGSMTLTSKGMEASDSVNLEEIAVRQRLTREMLHLELQGSVYNAFAAGHYDTAVLDAFKLLEDAVRNAASLPANVIGVQLMRQAYDPQKGPLRDPSRAWGGRWPRLSRCRKAQRAG